MRHLPSFDAARAWLHARAVDLAAGWRPPAPDATPIGELARSPAASRVAEHAVDAGLFSFHFEHRVHLALPEAWAPPGRPELAGAPEWERGVLAEAKYQSFRHDLAIGSYHPHHRPKWSTHELCHGLVGFAWRPDATPFFHATAGRLAELLPVALWYFFDEAWLRRCPDHQGDGDLFRATCAACEAAAAADPGDARAEEHIAQGLAFVERELAAVARSRRLGRPVPHRWATVDLASDGVAYADAHAARLASPAFAAWAEAVLVPGPGTALDLDDLEGRVLDVLAGLVGPHGPQPMAPTPAHGRVRWIAQDLTWRVAQAGAAAPTRVRSGLEPHLARLSDVVRTTASPDARPEAALGAAVLALAEAWPRSPALPAADEVLAVGYALPGRRPDGLGVIEGLRTGLPVLAELLGSHLPALADAFAADDVLERVPLITRFGRWLAGHHPGDLAELVGAEASLVALPEGRAHRLPGPPRDARRRLAPGVQVLRFRADVVDRLARAEAGGLEIGPDLALVDVDGGGLHEEPTALVVARDADGELLVLDVDPEAADALDALGEGAVPHLPPDEQAALEEHGVLVPVAWAESTSPGDHDPSAR